MVTGVIGLAIIVAICASGTLVAMAARSALTGLGVVNGSTAYNGSLSTGTQKVRAVESFPTPTFGASTDTTIPPVATIPSSQTPAPGPTPTASPTPFPTAPTGGGPGGQVPTTCNGAASGVTWDITPCPLTHGQGGTIVVVARAYAGAPINIVLSFGVCSGTSGCSYVYSPASGYHLDASGSLSISFTVPKDAQPGAAPVSGMINITGGPTVGISAAPVQ
jgi:hypothetical protein